MKRNDNKQSGFLDYVFNQSIGLLLGLLITGFFAWSVMYLAVIYPNEKYELNHEVFERQALHNEMDNEIEMNNIFLQGWFSGPDHLNKQILYIDYFEKHKTDEQLEPAFLSDALDWCEKSLTQLYNEKGKIEGYEFTGDINISEQQSYLELYAVQIDILQNIFDLMVNWNQESQVDRRERASSLLTQFHKYESSFEKLVQLGEQSVSQSELELMQYKHNYNNQIGQIALKKSLATIGVVLGTALLAFLTWYGIRFRGNAEESIGGKNPSRKKLKQG